MNIEQQETALPQLRRDIQLNEAPPEPEGGPAWTLYDPSANKYFKIGWLEFECLSRFNRCQTVRELIALLHRETTLRPDAEMIEGLISFLIQNNLINASNPNLSAHFTQSKEKRQKSWWETILHGYLFFTLPLFRPQRFLERSLPYVRFFLTRKFMAGVMILLAYGIFLSLQRFDEFTTTFMNYFNAEGVFLFITATIFVKIIHELGHAYVATKYGVPVSTVGIAFMVMYPVLYTETTNAWKLQNRKERVYIAAAGIMAELALASVALVLWHILTPGILQSLCFMVAVVSLLASLVVNLNPLMRFDGYYLFSDLVGVDNLQDRSLSFMRWRLRKMLWGWDDAPPETVPDDRRDFLVAFGFAICAYRFLLYLGIALLVYHLFFQPLGFILMAVELGFFIFLPVLREVKVWRDRFDEISATKRSRLYLALAGFGVLLMFVPMQGSVDVPAVLHARDYARLYAPAPARVDEILVSPGQTVKKDQLLFRLSSPHVEYSIESAEQKLRALESIRDTGQANPDLAKKRVTLDSEIDAAREELQGFLSQREMLRVRAPYDGVIRDLNPSLHAGQWVGSEEMLALMIDRSGVAISGYVKERDADRVVENNAGYFYPEFSPGQRYAVVLDQLDHAGTNEIYWTELASVHNGPLPSERGKGGVVRSLPRYTLYPAQFSIPEYNHNAAIPDFVIRGTIRLKARPTNLANILIKRAVSVVIRESGF